MHASLSLTPKELLITRLVTAGLKNRDLAKATGHTENTVKNKLKVIFDKTGMNSRLELALWYMAHRETL
jgi:DNA-binding NarL/FixJ family response regulator